MVDPLGLGLENDDDDGGKEWLPPLRMAEESAFQDVAGGAGGRFTRTRWSLMETVVPLNNVDSLFMVCGVKYIRICLQLENCLL